MFKRIKEKAIKKAFDYIAKKANENPDCPITDIHFDSVDFSMQRNGDMYVHIDVSAKANMYTLLNAIEESNN